MQINESTANRLLLLHFLINIHNHYIILHGIKMAQKKVNEFDSILTILHFFLSNFIILFSVCFFFLSFRLYRVRNIVPNGTMNERLAVGQQIIYAAVNAIYRPVVICQVGR